MPIRIMGQNQLRPVAATRTFPASAVLLAERWKDQGILNIRIERSGRSFTVAAFREQFVSAKIRKKRGQS